MADDLTEGRIQVGTKSEYLDTTVIEQSAGQPAHREATFNADPKDPDARQNTITTTPQFKKGDIRHVYGSIVIDPLSASINNTLNGMYEHQVEQSAIVAENSRRSMLIDQNEKPVFTYDPWREQRAPMGNEQLLIVEDYVTAFSTFQSVTRDAAGTTIIVTPKPNGSISITDIILSSTKVNGATVSLIFNDGTITETIFTIALTNQPVSMTIPIKGRMQGWRDARLELVTLGATAAFITAGYMKLPNGLPFNEWDEIR